MKTHEVNVRIELEDGYSAADLIEEMGMNLEWVISGVELESDGFGRLTPDESKRRKFVDDHWKPIP